MWSKVLKIMNERCICVGVCTIVCAHLASTPPSNSSFLLFSLSVMFYSLWSHGHKVCQAYFFSTILWSLLKLVSTESLIPSNHFILCLTLLLLPSIFPSIRVFSNESAFHIRWPKYWSFSISPCNEYSGLISFRMVWLVQGRKTLLSKGISRVFCSITVQKHQFFSSQPFLWFKSIRGSICDYWKNHSFEYMDICWQSDLSAF